MNELGFIVRPTVRQNIYDALGVPRYSSVEEIKDAYHNQARELKPLVDVGDISALERFSLISEFNLLSNDRKKAIYDVDLAMSDPTVRATLGDNPVKNAMYKMILGKKRFDKKSLADISLLFAGRGGTPIEPNKDVYLLFTPGRITLVHKAL